MHIHAYKRSIKLIILSCPQNWTNDMLHDINTFSKRSYCLIFLDTVWLQIFFLFLLCNWSFGIAWIHRTFPLQKTGAGIKVYSTCCPNSTDRIVGITGKRKVVVGCVEEIIELLQSVSSVHCTWWLVEMKDAWFIYLFFFT